MRKVPGHAFKDSAIAERLRSEIQQLEELRREVARRPSTPLPDLGLWSPDARIGHAAVANPDSAAAFLDSGSRR